MGDFPQRANWLLIRVRLSDPDGKVLLTKADILAGQDVFQRYGLMDQGMVWGHGTQRGPEFSATSLHIISENVRDSIAQKDYGKPYAELDGLQKDLVGVKTIHEIRENRYDPSHDTLTLTDAQVAGLKAVEQHWDEHIQERGKALRISARHNRDSQGEARNSELFLLDRMGRFNQSTGS